MIVMKLEINDVRRGKGQELEEKLNDVIYESLEKQK